MKMAADGSTAGGTRVNEVRHGMELREIQLLFFSAKFNLFQYRDEYILIVIGGVLVVSDSSRPLALLD
jgi:hypothetical protein